LDKPTLRFEYLVRPPKSLKTSDRFPLLLLIRGFGSNEQDLFGFADALPDDFYVVSVRAPITLFANGYAWYNIDFTKGIKFTDGEQANKSRVEITQFIEELQEHFPINSNLIYLAGFSQGAIMSYGIALNTPEKITGIIAMSGYILKDLLPPKVNPKAVNKLDLMSTHGTEDMVIPINLGKMAIDYMKSYQIDIYFKEYHGVGHGVSPECFQDILSWLNKVYSQRTS